MVSQIIHLIVGPKQNQIIKHCLKSWQQLKERGFEIKFWSDQTINVFIAEHYPFALDSIINARNHAEAADIARYAIVHYFGGYYVDWDIELLSSEKFLELCTNSPTGYLLQDPKNKTIASEAFSAHAGEPFLLELLDNIVCIYTNNFRDTMFTPQYSGPYRMREVYYIKKRESAQNIVPIKEAFLYDYDEIQQPVAKNTEVAMIHYWVHSWM